MIVGEGSHIPRDADLIHCLLWLILVTYQLL